MHRIFTIFIFAGLAVPAEHGFAQTWAEMTPVAGDAPAARRNAAAIYDPAGHRMIVFSGKTASGDRNDIWAFDLSSNTWTEITPNTGSAPAPRFTANCVYDPVQKSMLAWSGQGAQFFNDVWAFDLASHTWTQFDPPDPKPNIRYGAATIYDPIGRDLITFAGFTDQGRFDDTWRFDLDSNTWTEITPDDANPEQRCLHTASYDTLNRRMIVYGGQTSGARGDIWAFDIAQNRWTELTPQNSPAGRFFSPSIYDEKNHRFLVFGGNLGSTNSNDVLSFDLTAQTWQSLSLAGDLPVTREGATAVYIPSKDRIVIFGGRDSSNDLLNDVWSLNNLSPSTSVEHVSVLPENVKLHGNYPNPFNPATKIVFELPHRQHISLKIFDVQGRLMKTLVDAQFGAGVHNISWDGADEWGNRLPSGIYFYRLSSTSMPLQLTGKMILVQ